MQDQLTQSRLKELLDYEPETGIFRWKVARGAARVGGVAGYEMDAGYIQLSIGNKHYFAHRLAFLWMTGAWPEHEIDHIDGDRGNNRWANLRDVIRQENAHNIGTARCNSTCGFLGASWSRKRGMWQAKITVNRKTVWLGYFPTAEQAHAAYLKAKDELHPTHQRLRVAA